MAGLGTILHLSDRRRGPSGFSTSDFRIKARLTRDTSVSALTALIRRHIALDEVRTIGY